MVAKTRHPTVARVDLSLFDSLLSGGDVDPRKGGLSNISATLRMRIPSDVFACWTSSSIAVQCNIALPSVLGKSAFQVSPRMIGAHLGRATSVAPGFSLSGFQSPNLHLISTPDTARVCDAWLTACQERDVITPDSIAGRLALANGYFSLAC